MPNLTDFQVTDLVTQVLAAQYNRVIDATLRGELSNSETLTANKTLIDADFALQVYAPTAARDVELPAVAAANHPFYIVNTSSTYLLTVKNAGGTVICIVPASSAASLASTGSAWYVLSEKVVQTGWINQSETWTYASASTFTVPGDWTAIYKVGMRVSWVQTTRKYGIVVSSSYGAPNTTVTIAVNTDYVIANAAITEPAYSYLSDPLGFPGWFAFTPTWTNLTVGAASQASKYTVVGKILFFVLNIVFAADTSISGDVSFALPIDAATATGSGGCRLFDATGLNYIGSFINTAAGVCNLRAQKVDATYSSEVALSSTIPFTWTTSDQIKANGFYRLA